MQSLASLSRFTQNPYLQKREVHPRGGPLVKKEQRLRPPSPKTQGTLRKMPHITACAPNQDWESVGSLWAHSRFCGVGIAAEPPSSSHQKRRGCVVMAIRRPCLITPISPRQLARDADTSASRERTAPREWCLACTTLRRDAAASATADAVLCTLHHPTTSTCVPATLQWVREDQRPGGQVREPRQSN